MKHYRLTASLIAALSVYGAMAQNNVPKLVVNISIDRLRTDYLETFSPLYGQDGLRMLLNNGMVFTSASMPFIPIDRASAIAAISTGTTPYYNGITGQKWIDRQTLRPVNCTDNDAKNLTASTIGDELKIVSGGKAIVCSVAPFQDAAEMAGGHISDGVYWIDDKTGQWYTTAFYAKSLPSWVSTFNATGAPAAKPIENWTPITTFTGSFNYMIGKKHDSAFKHTFHGSEQYNKLLTSGLINSYVTDMALQCSASTAMGNDEIPDLLNVTYYAGKYDNLAAKDGQMEIQDTYVRLDREIAKMIKGLEGRVGKDRVLFILTSTGYDDEENVDYSKYGIPSGTFYINRIANLMNIYFGAIYGQGRYVDTSFRNEIFLNHILFEQKRISFTDALDRAHEFLLQAEGVKDVYTFARLMQADDSPLLNKIRGGYNPVNRGDILIEVAPGWRVYNEDTREVFTSNASHPQFPIIIYGANTKAEKITTQVTVDRIAPTIAKSIHIRAPNACSAEPLY